jgi:hypothetical protein
VPSRLPDNDELRNAGYESAAMMYLEYSAIAADSDAREHGAPTQNPLPTDSDPIYYVRHSPN